jgi:hypothetical protein
LFLGCRSIFSFFLVLFASVNGLLHQTILTFHLTAEDEFAFARRRNGQSVNVVAAPAAQDVAILTAQTLAIRRART